ncbi:hypothetical protein [Planctomyces sp. SH-PL14]|uniref:hypothetical protein n=1 Tax=Planctomyces sp. SH-PL14 TaxID=1632864 RepID=UPI00078C1702|nr:hypothetical protein [Planctomyces sp. SH-PL14]AMV18271.1 hypothetical protein VT03_10305 [Planctomyces sp. SH-PL14]
MLETCTRKPIHVSVGEDDSYFADFDPDDMDPNSRPLDGGNGELRLIVSATAEVMEGGTVTIPPESIEVVAENTVINGETIQAGTGVRFRGHSWQVRPDQQETVVKILAVLDDDSVKPLGVRFKVEA